MTKRIFLITSLVILSILLAGVVGCTPQSTPLSVASTPTVPPGWVTFNNDGTCGFAIDHPSDIQGDSQGEYSWTFNHTTEDPSGPLPNFIYISVVPDDFQSTEPGAIYNYDPAQAQLLLNIPVGGSTSLIEDPNLAPSYTYTRLPDATLSNRAAQAYENTQPWEFPPSTKEIRYYLKGAGCTFLVGGYMSTVGSGQVGAIDQDSFEQIVNTFRLR